MERRRQRSDQAARSVSPGARSTVVRSPYASREDLSPRSQTVLREIVRRFVMQGEPVGSRTISRIFPEPLSPATIRNIMADLEEAGFIGHPHTSAGRVPTEQGYRFYVDTLMNRPGVPRAEREAIARGLRRVGEISEVLEQTSRLLSTLSRCVGVVVVPELRRSKLRHIDFVRLGKERVLVVLVSTAGVVHHSVVETGVDWPQDELDRCGKFLSERFHGKSLPEIREDLLHLMEEERAQYDRLVEGSVVLGRRVFLENPGAAEVFVEGTGNLVVAPDLADVDKMQGLLRALEEKERLVKILDGCLQSDALGVRIGSETREPGMASCAVVASTYHFPDGTPGNLGVIGPTRMEYERVVGLVREIADRLSRVLSDVAPDFSQ